MAINVLVFVKIVKNFVEQVIIYMIEYFQAEVSTVNLLLELGAKVNMAAGDGRTALIIVCDSTYRYIKTFN